MTLAQSNVMTQRRVSPRLSFRSCSNFSLLQNYWKYICFWFLILYCSIFICRFVVKTHSTVCFRSFSLPLENLEIVTPCCKIFMQKYSKYCVIIGQGRFTDANTIMWEDVPKVILISMNNATNCLWMTTSRLTENTV